MKIKKRLLVSFIIIILVPVITGAALFAVTAGLQLRELKKSYGYVSEDHNYTSNTIQLLSSITIDEYNKIRDLSIKKPDKLADINYLNELNNKLSNQHSHIDVKQGEKLIYTGRDIEQNLSYELPEYGSGLTDATAGYYQGGEHQSLIKQIDFQFSNGEKGSIYIISQVSSFLPEMKELAFQIGGIILLILILTGIAVTIWVYRGIINPVKKLQSAAEHIKQGNLDFSLDPSGDDEMAELCKTFEEMRIRLKESTEEKVKQDQESKILISNICHDLKTPITAIQGYVEGIMDGVADTPEKQARYLRTIHSKANEMNTLINELTVYSKLDTNRAVYNFSKINVHDYFEDCIEEIGMELEAENVQLIYQNYVEDHSIVIADPEQLRRVINNIIGNAVKYMNREPKSIHIRIKDVGDFIQVEIEDTGKGISGKDLPYIFERFFRADSSRNETKGNGIGLSIVKKILDDHGGKIWATSKENVGTTMYFVLRKYQEVPNE